MKKENIIIKIFKILYPFLIWFTSQIIVSSIFLGISLSIYFENNPANILSEEALARGLEYATYQTTLPSLIVSSIICIIISYFILRKSDKDILSIEKLKNIGYKNILFTIASAFLIFVIINKVLDVFNLYELFPSHNEVVNLLTSGSLLLQILATVVFVPIGEELIFRGLMYNNGKKYMPYVFAMILQGVIFGLAHGNILQGAYAFILAIIICIFYEKTNNIFVPILFHMVFNGCNLIVETSLFAFFYNYIFIILIIALGGFIYYKKRYRN